MANLTFKNFNYLYIDSRKINLFILCKTLLKIFFDKNNLNLRQLYKKKFIPVHFPKVAISHHINKRGFECKSLCPEIKVIVYQFSYFHEHKPISSQLIRIGILTIFYPGVIKIRSILVIKIKNKVITGSIRNNSTVGPKNN